MNITELFLRYGFVALGPSISDPHEQVEAVGTLLQNMAYYGYVPDMDVLRALRSLDSRNLKTFWNVFSPALRAVTGTNRNMDDFVVYKNFPKEVLRKSEAEYWIAQILMYWGVPNEYFTETVEARPAMTEMPKLKVLALGNAETLLTIWSRLRASTARWNDIQTEAAKLILQVGALEAGIDAKEFSFKENAIVVMAEAFDSGIELAVSSPQDVMRLAAALSEGDISLRSRVRFRSFRRPERRILLGLLNSCDHLVETMALRREPWLHLLHALRPGDYKGRYPNVSKAYDALYREDYTTYNSEIETGLAAGVDVLPLLTTRPGDFMRRFHKAYAVYGSRSVSPMTRAMDKLSTSQLVKFDRYLATINGRGTLMAPPGGNWTRAKVLPNTKATISADDLRQLRSTIGKIVEDRLHHSNPLGFDVDPMVEGVKLQTNDQKLAPYGRGTVFQIPDRIKFLRSASYWMADGGGFNIWYDIGWTFYGEGWSPMSTCDWSNPRSTNGAVFSGDPTNSKDLKGRACQMVDLYLDQLAHHGVRYAMWSLMCYSHKSFAEADDVLATLQWGVEPESGKLYEPSRAQMVFPVTGKHMTKFIAYVDLSERTLVYIDVNLNANVQSVGKSLYQLAEVMPAYVEYLNALPSVGDLFQHARRGTIPVLYSDADHVIDYGPAYVFSRSRETNSFTPLDLEPLLAAK